MGETKILGKVCDSATGGAVYEDVGPAGTDVTAVMIGPKHWADFGGVVGDSEADRALRRGIALHNLDSKLVNPVIARVATKRQRVKRRKKFAHAQKVYARGGRLPREFGWWALVYTGAFMILLAVLGLGLMLIWQAVQSGASVCS